MKIPAQARLTAFYTAILSAVLVLSSTFVYLRVSKSLHKDFRNEMIADGRLMAELFKEELKLNALDEFKKELDEFGFNLQILDANRNPVVRMEEWQKLGLSIDEATFAELRENPVYREINLDGKPHGFFNRPIHIPAKGDYTLHMLRSQSTLKRTLNELLQWMAAIKLLMVVAAGCLGYLFAARTLRAEQLAHSRLRNFTADASHELRIPLTSLRGHLEVALRKDRSPEDYKEAIENALEDAEQLSKLTRDLLLLAQSDASELKLDIQDVDLDPFIEDIFEQAKAFPNEKNIDLKKSSIPRIVVRFDPDRIRQLFFILLDNAFKYGRRNGSVQLGAQALNGVIKLTVMDDGIGIPSGDLKKIFDRFYRVDKSRSRDMGGTGLGLSIAKRVVDAHHGEIEVKSEEGKGTFFTITLPMKK